MLHANRKFPLHEFTEKPIHEIIDWSHPAFARHSAGEPGSRLLASWRERQAYAYFFDRHQIENVLRSVTPADWREYEQTLAFILKWKRGRKPAKSAAWPVPIRRGRPLWSCFTAKRSEQVCAANRFQWLPGAALAARRSRNRDAREAVFALIDDWLAACSPPVALIEGKERAWKFWYSPWAPLNTGLRIQNWIMVLHLLWDCAELTPKRFAKYMTSVWIHREYLGRIPPRIDKNALGNHFVMESNGLLNASLFPWIKGAKTGLRTALHNLARCMQEQILPDGVHIERAPGYHRACMTWFAGPILLAKLNGWNLPGKGISRLERMLEFGLQVLLPDGTPAKSGDCGSVRRDNWQSERLLSFMFGRALPMEKARSFGISPFIQQAAGTCRRNRKRFRLATHFPQGGFAIGRSSWEPSGNYVMVKLDAYGGGHSHGDFLSFVFAWRGRLLIDERGTWAYDSDRKSVACKSVEAHNVLRIGDREVLDMGEGNGYWQKRLPIVEIQDTFCTSKKNGRLHAGGRVAWADGTWWRRELLFVPATGLKVIDEFESPRSEDVTVQFHIRSKAIIRTSPHAFRTNDRGQPNIRIAVRGDGPVMGRMSSCEVYDAFYSPVRASLLKISSKPRVKGRIETIISGA